MHAESGSQRPHLANHFPASPLTAVISADQPIYILGGQSYSNTVAVVVIIAVSLIAS
jgi:hypothetical protein